MAPLQPKEFMLYYAALMFISLLLFLRRKPRRGMRLRLRGPARDSNQADGRKQPTEIYSHIQSDGERPLNVVFNYNGHSWDAYEVLGLPAGSSPENVEAAYREGMSKVDEGSKAFMEAAYKAIQEQWKSYRKASAG